MRFLLLCGLCGFWALGFVFLGMPAQAQSDTATVHAKRVADHCVGTWETPECLKVISQSTLVLAANYAGVLQANKKSKSVEMIKQHCAAATAAAKKTFPAEAMTSAYTECANTIYDVSNMSGVKPDLSHYQLLIGAVWCLSEDRRCGSIEQQLSGYQ